VKEHAQTDSASNNEERMKEIEELKEKLNKCTRTEARRINDRIQDLQAEKNKVLNDIQKINDQIEKKH
jgi:FtsZ-binding cell division protein ZapB